MTTETVSESFTHSYILPNIKRSWEINNILMTFKKVLDNEDWGIRTATNSHEKFTFYAVTNVDINGLFGKLERSRRLNRDIQENGKTHNGLVVTRELRDNRNSEWRIHTNLHLRVCKICKSNKSLALSARVVFQS